MINLCLIPYFGAIGAAIGTLIAEMSVCIYQVYKIRKNIAVNRYIISSVPFVLSGVVMFLLLFNIDLSVKSEILKLCIKIIIGILVYSTSFFLQLYIYRKLFKR